MSFLILDYESTQPTVQNSRSNAPTHEITIAKIKKKDIKTPSLNFLLEDFSRGRLITDCVST